MPRRLNSPPPRRTSCRNLEAVVVEALPDPLHNMLITWGIDGGGSNIAVLNEFEDNGVLVITHSVIISSLGTDCPAVSTDVFRAGASVRTLSGPHTGALLTFGTPKLYIP